MTLKPCAHCQRHVEATETICPFCQTPLSPSLGTGNRLMRRLALGGAMLFTAAAATACYGTPPVPDGLASPTPLPSGGGSDTTTKPANWVPPGSPSGNPSASPNPKPSGSP